MVSETSSRRRIIERENRQVKGQLMMNRASGSRWYHPFTARQWQELEDQALFYKYMISVDVGRKADPEEAGGRCRRTDGKKWRCSKEACPDSKYCQKHMHRGRNRSRKSVELNTPIPYRKSNGMKDDECFKTSLGGASWQLAINNNTSSSNPSENAYSFQQQDETETERKEKVMHHFLI
ncbi:putative transcription factor interactor and regulator C3H-WRC/GRF family [Helianthus annuus]|nr:putative transcription factor interactor and regulator C3H-WRC/GRF family [Helianthus annuus]KAJ0531830.1 putative transcription factor interactor and regulator C3H-WRC/GRF family [Helianthus annuus]